MSRVVFRRSLTGQAAGSLRVYRDGEAEPAREFIHSEAGADSELSFAELWLQRSSEAPNHALRWCYHLPAGAAADVVGSQARVAAISLQPLRPELTVGMPTEDPGLSAVVGEQYRVRNLRVGVVLHTVSGSVQPEALPAAMLSVRSRIDMVYWMPEGEPLQPLNWSASVTPGGEEVGESLALWLPQARLARRQVFELLGNDGLVLVTTEVAMPVVSRQSGEMPARLALNQLCAGVSFDVCRLLVLPGNGLGGWSTATNTQSVITNLVPASLEEGNCLRILVGEGLGLNGLRILFSWKAPPTAEVKLGLYLDQRETASGFVTDMKYLTTHILALAGRAEGRQLSWCLEGSSAAAATSQDWGLFFRTQSSQQFVFNINLLSPDMRPVDLELAIRALLYVRDCGPQGERGKFACLVATNDFQELAAVLPRPGLSITVHPGSPAARELTSRLLLLIDRGELDADGDGDYDERDLRLILRYQAGLRGEALSSSSADRALGHAAPDEARLGALFGP